VIHFHFFFKIIILTTNKVIIMRKIIVVFLVLGCFGSMPSFAVERSSEYRLNELVDSISAADTSCLEGRFNYMSDTIPATDIGYNAVVTISSDGEYYTFFNRVKGCFLGSLILQTNGDYTVYFPGLFKNNWPRVADEKKDRVKESVAIIRATTPHSEMCAENIQRFYMALLF